MGYIEEFGEELETLVRQAIAPHMLEVMAEHWENILYVDDVTGELKFDGFPDWGEYESIGAIVDSVFAGEDATIRNIYEEQARNLVVTILKESEYINTLEHFAKLLSSERGYEHFSFAGITVSKSDYYKNEWLIESIAEAIRQRWIAVNDIQRAVQDIEKGIHHRMTLSSSALSTLMKDVNIRMKTIVDTLVNAVQSELPISSIYNAHMSTTSTSWQNIKTYGFEEGFRMLKIQHIEWSPQEMIASIIGDAYHLQDTVINDTSEALKEQYMSNLTRVANNPYMQFIALVYYKQLIDKLTMYDADVRDMFSAYRDIADSLLTNEYANFSEYENRLPVPQITLPKEIITKTTKYESDTYNLVYQKILNQLAVYLLPSYIEDLVAYAEEQGIINRRVIDDMLYYIGTSKAPVTKDLIRNAAVMILEEKESNLDDIHLLKLKKEMYTHLLMTRYSDELIKAFSVVFDDREILEGYNEELISIANHKAHISFIYNKNTGNVSVEISYPDETDGTTTYFTIDKKYDVSDYFDPHNEYGRQQFYDFMRGILESLSKQGYLPPIHDKYSGRYIRKHDDNLQEAFVPIFSDTLQDINLVDVVYDKVKAMVNNSGGTATFGTKKHVPYLNNRGKDNKQNKRFGR